MKNFKSKPITRAFDITSLLLFGILASSLLLFTIWIAKENFDLDAQPRSLSKEWRFFGEFNEQAMTLLFNFLSFLMPTLPVIPPLYVTGRVIANKLDRCIQGDETFPINNVQSDISEQEKTSITKSLIAGVRAIPRFLNENRADTAIIGGLTLGTGILSAAFGGKTAYECSELFLAAQSEYFWDWFRKTLAIILEISQPIGFGFIGMIAGFTTGFTAKAIGNTLRTLYAKMTGEELEPHIFKKIMDHLKLYKRENLVIAGGSIFVGLLYLAACIYVADYAFGLERGATIPCLGKEEEEKRAINAGLQVTSSAIVPSIMATAATACLAKIGLFLFNTMPCGKHNEEERIQLTSNP